MSYLSHAIKPYINDFEHVDFPNADYYMEHLIQLPINLSKDDTKKLLQKEKRIENHFKKLKL